MFIALQAGIFEPAPVDENAVATTAGLWLNCINSGLYMANYNLIIPTITDLCAHIGAPNSMVGVLIGACDIATVMSTMGTRHATLLLDVAGHLKLEKVRLCRNLRRILPDMVL